MNKDVIISNDIGLIILTRNAANLIDELLNKLASQNLQPENILIIDSTSTDNTIEKIKARGCKYHIVKRDEFNHGATRKLATQLIEADFYIFMTQDAIPVNADAIKNLMAAFENPKVGCAYGRQLPNKNANVLATHARLFNYPAQSLVKGYEDRFTLGIKTCFNSDSFAAYRKMALTEVGGFPQEVIVGEDVYVAAKMLLQGWLVAYQAEAMVYHSHNYSILQEFKRYFDIGVAHAMNYWIIESFSSPSQEGVKYIKAELRYCLRQHAYFAFIRSLFTVLAKYFGYKLGGNYQRIPNWVRKKISMSSFYWNNK
jgi:rhamnosyltransferase